MQLKDRFVSLKNIIDKAFQSFAMEDLESKAVLLSGKYPKINKEQFVIEIKSFKHQMIELLQNKRPMTSFI